MEITLVQTRLLFTRSDARSRNDAIVKALAESIREVGILQPIRVRKKLTFNSGVEEELFEIIAGAHRHEAAQQLGLEQVPCILTTDDDLHAELAMIDENLMRAELSPADRALNIAKRKFIYEALHPETRHGENQHTRSGQVVHSSFADETAAATGKDARTIRRDAERGSKITDEALALISGGALDTGKYLDQLKQVPIEEQVSAVRRDLDALQNVVRKGNEPKSTARSKIDSDIKQRAAREVAEMIAEHIPSGWWDAVKANLYAAGATNIAHELSNLVGQSVFDRGVSNG